MNAAFRKDGRRILVPVVPVSQHGTHIAAKTGTVLAFRLRASPPLVISHQEKNSQRIAALDEQAEALRLKRGMGIADARAMYPSIEIIEADPEADRRLIEGLADWCDRYTPLVALDGTDGLFLDITGCAHLFGGERAMLDDICLALFHQGFDVRAGLASTPGAAWAAARFSSGNGILDAGQEEHFWSPFRSPPCGSIPASAPAWRASA